MTDGTNDRQRGIRGHNPHLLRGPEIRIIDSVRFFLEQWSSQGFVAHGKKSQQQPLAEITNFRNNFEL